MKKTVVRILLQNGPQIDHDRFLELRKGSCKVKRKDCEKKSKKYVL